MSCRIFLLLKKTSKKKILIISNLKWEKMKNLEEREINFEEKFLEMLKDKNFKQVIEFLAS